MGGGARKHYCPPFLQIKKKKVDEEGKGKQRYRKKLGRGGVEMGS